MYGYFDRGGKMYTISKKTKMNIERVIGISIEKLINMDVEEERSWIEKRNHSPNDKGMELLVGEILCWQGEKYGRLRI